MKGSKALGELLRFLRGGLSQEELSGLLHIDRSLVSKAENGKFTPSEEIVNKWIEIGYENFKRMRNDAVTYNAMMAVAAERNARIGA